MQASSGPPWPAYQPSRSISTRYRPKGRMLTWKLSCPPGETLSSEAYPSTLACDQAPRAQLASPRRAFSCATAPAERFAGLTRDVTLGSIRERTTQHASICADAPDDCLRPRDGCRASLECVEFDPRRSRMNCESYTRLFRVTTGPGPTGRPR